MTVKWLAKCYSPFFDMLWEWMDVYCLKRDSVWHNCSFVFTMWWCVYRSKSCWNSLSHFVYSHFGVFLSLPIRSIVIAIKFQINQFPSIFTRPVFWLELYPYSDSHFLLFFWMGKFYFAKIVSSNIWPLAKWIRLHCRFAMTKSWTDILWNWRYLLKQFSAAWIGHNYGLTFFSWTAFFDISKRLIQMTNFGSFFLFQIWIFVAIKKTDFMWSWQFTSIEC